MPRQNRQRPVYLLRQHYPRKLMWQGHAAERKEQVCPLEGGARPSVRRTDGKDNFLDAAIAQAAKVRRKLLGGELLASTVKKNS